MKRREYSEEEQEEMVECYIAGATLQAIGAQFGVSRGTVSRILINHGISIRPTGRIKMCDEERRERRKQNSAKYRAAHHEEVLQRTRVWREQNPEKAREATKRWEQSERGKEMLAARPIDKEVISERNRRSHERLSADPEYRKKKSEAAGVWQKANPDKVLARGQRQRARKAGAGEYSLTLNQWEDIKLAQDGRCWYCGIEAKLEQEHKIPLVRGGSHTSDNVVGSCGPCNRSKHTLTADEFIAKRAS